MTRPRVLIVAPFPPSRVGAHGGSRAIAHLVTGLVADAVVAVAYLRGPEEGPLEPGLRVMCEAVLELERRGPARTRLARLGRRLRLTIGLLRGRPMWVTDYAPTRRSLRQLEQLISEWRPNILQLEYPLMAAYLRDVGQHVRVLTDHDPEHEAADQRALGASGLSRLVLSLDARAWRRQLSRAAAHVHAIVAFTEEDRQSLRSIAPQARIEVIPLTVPLPAEALDPVGHGMTLLFIGNFAHPPNRDAAIWLGRDILPLIRRRIPSVRLELVGDDPAGELQRLFVHDPAIVVSGWVPDVHDLLDRSAVIVAPIRFGGGMRVKVMEALAAGKAVVTTPLGAAGLSAATTRQLLLAQDAREVADATVRLLEDPALRRDLGRRARAWAEANSSPTSRSARYLGLYGELRTPASGDAPRGIEGNGA